jgi:two-component system chemotaxis sensor kinase CheA
MLSAKLAVGQLSAELRRVGSNISSLRKEWRGIQSELHSLLRTLEKNGNRDGLQQDGARVRKLSDFFKSNDVFIRSVDGEMRTLLHSANQDHRSISTMVDNLLDDIKKTLMLPFSTVLEIFPRFVRELSREQGKEIELTLRGAEVEADRRILEEIKDPLMHLVRNCVDHGVEKPKERERKGKPPRASITIAVSQQDGDKVEIIIADDGSGIDAAKVRSAAKKAGLIKSDEAQPPSDQEVLPLIFVSGISTSPFVTDVSGRGLGLTIVREKVERLGGVVSFETHANEGTTFRISLPLTLARFRGLLVRLADRLFVIPSLNIERALAITKSQIKTVENKETIQLQGQAVSLVRLDDVLQLPRQEPPRGSKKKLTTVVLVSGNARIAFLVDEVLHEQEVLVKSLGPQLCRVENISGATVLGNGKVMPILNPLELMKSAVRATHVAIKPEPVAGKKGEEKKKSVLVVEDSITARTLLKNILEMAGYVVATAVDGVDAFTQLRTNEFDVVLSDVDMPRMNGFDLTARIRGEKKFAELPVVLLTALESKEDKERGIDVGANAYLVKSSFDQSNLLEVIGRLI